MLAFGQQLSLLRCMSRSSTVGLALDGRGEARAQLVEALELSAQQFRGGRLSLAVTQGLDPELAGMANTAYRDCIARSMERLIEAVNRTALLLAIIEN